ncbi:MAG TPA: hypothetical protein VK254_00280 [Candidatus Bathyarchaeia archaeon]|nr:hypothetical protein [Candidatus Bathyarchaeia archaeon]
MSRREVEPLKISQRTMKEKLAEMAKGPKAIKRLKQAKITAQAAKAYRKKVSPPTARWGGQRYAI